MDDAGTRLGHGLQPNYDIFCRQIRSLKIKPWALPTPGVYALGELPVSLKTSGDGSKSHRRIPYKAHSSRRVVPTLPYLAVLKSLPYTWTIISFTLNENHSQKSGVATFFVPTNLQLYMRRMLV
jgi:hypothetical protein